jgi:capsular polysaccharide transport system permease protein
MTHISHSKERESIGHLAKLQWQVLHALMLRDIKTRFFGSAWGMLISIAWPVAHIIIVLVVNVVAGRLVPYGDSAVLWFATGMIPFAAFQYTSRFIMLGIVNNKPLVVFPRVKIMDILLARAIVEVLSAGAVILIMVGIFIFLGIDFVPTHITDAAFALGAALLLGLGAGVISAVIAQAWPIWVMIYSLSMIVFWLISGVLFVPDNLPEVVRYYASFNPILQIVLWFRSGYYDDYGYVSIDRPYTIGFALVILAVGLVLERFVRGRLLQG